MPDAPPRRRLRLIISVLALIGVAWYVFVPPGPPSNLGLQVDRLSPCPSSPNCVSSFETGEARIEPLAFTGSASDAVKRLLTTLEAMEDATIILHDERYVHCEFRTPLLRFVDDVEFLVAETQIHVRSASRRGHSDLGTNRKRVEEIRSRFER
ncbi:MAG: DUF1499 domain-containing protein [Planctomycetota bacterium]